jgi:hypothetical protein
LFGSDFEIRVQDLGVDDDDVVICVVEAIPGFAYTGVISVQSGRGDGMSRHRRVRLVTDIVIACAKVRVQTKVIDLGEGFIQSLREVGCLRIFLYEVSQMYREVYVQLLDEGQGSAASIGLMASRLELEWTVPGINHVMRISNNRE